MDLCFSVTSGQMYSKWPELFHEEVMGDENGTFEDLPSDDVAELASMCFATWPDAALVTRLVKVIHRRACTVWLPGIYIEMFVFVAAMELGIFDFRSAACVGSTTLDPYQLFTKSTDVFLRFDPMADMNIVAGTGLPSFKSHGFNLSAPSRGDWRQDV